MNQPAQPAQPGQMSEAEDQTENLDPTSPEAEWRAKYGKMPLKDVAARMAELKLEIDQVKAKLGALGAEFDVIRIQVVPERFANEGVTNMRFDGIGRLGLTSDAWCNVLPGMGEQLFSVLRDIGSDDLIKPTVNPSSLKSLVKDLHKEHVTKEVEFDPSAEPDTQPEPDDFEKISQVVKFTPFMRAAITKS